MNTTQPAVLDGIQMKGKLNIVVRDEHEAHGGQEQVVLQAEKPGRRALALAEIARREQRHARRGTAEQDEEDADRCQRQAHLDEREGRGDSPDALEHHERQEIDQVGRIAGERRAEKVERAHAAIGVGDHPAILQRIVGHDAADDNLA